jgi:acyl dehydratase
VKYFEDAEIDSTTVFPGRYMLTEENILAMGREWDPIPIHTDKALASDSIFGDIVASTVHLFAIATKLSRTDKEEWAVVSSLGMGDFINHAAGYAGDILEARSTFTDKRVSASRAGMGVVHYKCELCTQDNKCLFEFGGAALYQLRAS